MDYLAYIKKKLSKYNIDIKNINKNTKIKEIYLDSFDLLQIIISIEDELKIKVDDNDIYKKKNINDIILLIKKLKKNTL